MAFHGLAAADTVYSVAGQEPAVDAARAAEESEMEVELDQGMQALIIGLLAMLEEDARRPDTPPTDKKIPTTAKKPRAA
ncbi:hypothetical protein D3C71_1983640 [compost metagenome]